MNEQKVLFWNFDDLLALGIQICTEERDLSFNVNWSVWIRALWKISEKF